MKTGEGAATVIGSSARLRGDLIATGDVLVEGQIEGTIQVTGARVTIGREANIHADVAAQEIVVLGKVDGTLRAAERVELRSTAVVAGDIFAKRFAMEPEAVLHGRVDPSLPVEQKPVPTAAPAGVAENAPAVIPNLFTGQRSGLAAAARNFGQAGTPAGMSALAEDSTDEVPATHEA